MIKRKTDKLKKKYDCGEKHRPLFGIVVIGAHPLIGSLVIGDIKTCMEIDGNE